MAEPQFDPSQMLRFDLDRGVIEITGSPPRLVVSAEALARLASSAGQEASADFGQSVGSELGARAAGRLGDGAAAASIETWVEHLGGEWALAGLGDLGLERWGRALVLTVSGSPLAAGGDALCSSILRGALQRALSRDVHVVVLRRSGPLARYLVTSAAGGERVSAWLTEGVAWGDALARLHEPRGES